MDKSLLQALMRNRMKERGLSLREAAKEIGVSHTTVARIIKGHSLDLDTYIAICNWLGVSPSSFMEAQLGEEEGLSARLTSLLKTYPEIAQMLEQAMSRMQAKELDPAVVRELVAYMAFRLTTSP